MTRVALCRDLGRPEAALIGVQYIGNHQGEHPRHVRPARSSTGVAPHRHVNRVSRRLRARRDRGRSHRPSSPPGTRVVAEIPHLFGPKFTAQKV